MRTIAIRLGLLLALGSVACFDEPPEVGGLSTSGDSGASVTGTGLSTSNSEGTSSPTNVTMSASDTTGGGMDTDDPAESASSGPPPLDACEGVPTTCTPLDYFCEPFEGFNWDTLMPPWNLVPGGSMGWYPSEDPVACGMASLEAFVTEGDLRGVLGASIVPAADFALEHEFGGYVLVDPECVVANKNPVRALVLQYLQGGMQIATVEVWFDEERILVRRDGMTVATSQPLPTALGDWHYLSVVVEPGGMIRAQIDEIDFPPATAPEVETLNGLNAQLLVGPVLQSGQLFAGPCLQFFDDVYVAPAFR